MNNYNAIGRVGKDAVLRHTQGGDAVLGFSLAVDNGWGDKKQTVWFDCSLWGKRAEKLAEHITKGSQIGVTGELGAREHDGKTYLTLRLADVTFAGGKGERQDNGGQSEPKHRQARQSPDEGFPDDAIPFISRGCLL